MTTKTLSLITATLLLTQLSFADTTLEDIMVVSTNKVPTSIQNTTANISVITADDIAEHGYQTVAQAINAVAGISVTHSGGLGQQTSFFVRGADSGKVLVLLDGMRLNDPSTTNGTALLDSLTTSNIAQIEIIKGGSGNIWGSNASAAVINIITKEAKKGLHSTIGVSYGSYATTGTDVALSYKGDKLSAQILTSYLDTKGFSALAPRNAEADGYNNKNANLKLAYRLNANNHIQLSYNKIKTKTQYDNSFSTLLANDNYAHATSSQNNIALDYRYTLGNYSATFKASKGDYARDYYTSSAFGKGHNVYTAILKEYALINAYRYETGRVIVGLEYKDIFGFNQYNTSTPNQAQYTNKAVYLSNSYHLDTHTLLETNIRYDKYSKFDNKTSYKIGLKRQNDFIEGFTTSANYYTSADAPSAYQYANPAPATLLKPSYTKGYDLSIGYKELLNITYFNNKVQDSIDYVGNAGYANIAGKSKFKGLEVESNYAFDTLHLLSSINYTHLFTFKKEDGTDLIRRAKDTLNASLTYYLDEMHFGIDALYIGNRLDNNGATKVSTGNYTVWNLNFSTPIKENLTLNINAQNIFDKTYQSVYKYASPGRSVYAKINYTF